MKYITNEGDIFTFKTNKNALKYKLVSINIADEKPEMKCLVEEKEDVLQSVRCFNQTKLILNYMHDCKVNYFHVIVFILSISILRYYIG